MSKLVIGIAGEIGSGKTTVGEYIKKKYNGTALKFSGPLRDILNRLGLEETRVNMQSLSTVLRETFGQQLLSSVLLSDVKKSDSKIIFIDGIRRFEDVASFKDLPEFLLIFIDTPTKIRFERITERRENPDDTAKTFSEFKKDAKAETELMIHELKDVAQQVIENSGPKSDLYSHVDTIIDNFFKNNPN